MNIAVAAVIVVGVSAVAIAALLFIRRRAPDGGYFNDGDRAAGFFGVLATGYAVLLGFIVFLAFTSYDKSLVGGETEALLLAQQFETAQFFPPDARAELSGELACYGRYAVHQEWPAMEDGSLDNQLSPWGVELFRTLEATEPGTPAEEAAFSKWMDQTSDRESARNDRIHGAEGVIPAHLWIVIYVGAAMVFVFMLFFADSGERALVQGMMIGSVVAVMTSTLLIIGMLNSPYSGNIGSIEPAAMERTLGLIEEARSILGLEDDLPCDDEGVPLAASND
jgi:hypothetical protein